MLIMVGIYIPSGFLRAKTVGKFIWSNFSEHGADLIFFDQICSAARVFLEGNLHTMVAEVRYREESEDGWWCTRRRWGSRLVACPKPAAVARHPYYDEGQPHPGRLREASRCAANSGPVPVGQFVFPHAPR